MAKNGNTLTYRVEQLENSVDKLDGKVDQLMSNHLPHLQEQMARLETRIIMFTAINVATIVISILLHEIL